LISNSTREFDNIDGYAWPLPANYSHYAATSHPQGLIGRYAATSHSQRLIGRYAAASHPRGLIGRYAGSLCIGFGTERKTQKLKKIKL